FCQRMSYPSTSASSTASRYHSDSRCNFPERLDTLSLQPYSSCRRSTTSCMVYPPRMICALISFRMLDFIKVPPFFTWVLKHDFRLCHKKNRLRWGAHRLWSIMKFVQILFCDRN